MYARGVLFAAINYQVGGLTQNFEIDGTLSEIDGIEIVEPKGRSRKSGINATSARFGVGIGGGVVGTGMD